MEELIRTLFACVETVSTTGSPGSLLSAQSGGNKDSFQQLLLNSPTYLETGICQLEEKLDTVAFDHEILAEYRLKFRDDVQSMLRQFLRCRQELSNINGQAEFLLLYDKVNLLKNIIWLHQRLTTETPGSSLLGEVINLYGRNWQQFELWQQHVSLTLSQACCLHAIYLLWKHQTYVIGLEANREKIISGNAVKEIKLLQKWVEDILSELEIGSLKARSFFLFTKCGDELHQDCCSASDELCNELSVKVHKFLGDTSHLDITVYSENLSAKLAAVLRQDYPQFQWSVILLESDYSDFFYRYTDMKRKESIWQQTFGTLSKPILRGKLKRYGRIQSTGLQFGQLLCYRYKAGNEWRRKALVFWAQDKDLLPPKWDPTIGPWGNGAVGTVQLGDWATTPEKLAQMEAERESAKPDDSDQSPEPFVEFCSSSVSSEYESKKLLFVVDENLYPDRYQMDLTKVGKTSFPLTFRSQSSINGGVNLALFWPCESAENLNCTDGTGAPPFRKNTEDVNEVENQHEASDIVMKETKLRLLKQNYEKTSPAEKKEELHRDWITKGETRNMNTLEDNFIVTFSLLLCTLALFVVIVVDFLYLFFK